MKIKTRSIALLLLASIILLPSCVKGLTETALRRDTDAINIAYNEGATATVTVRYAGEWYAVSDADWISVSPDASAPVKGDGETFQKVTVTVSRNQGEARKGTFRIMSKDGAWDAPVEVTQENGQFRIDNPSVYGTLARGEEAAASLLIKYYKATGKEKITVTASVDGMGGLSIAPTTVYEVPGEGDGSFSIAFKGAPVAMGGVSIPVEVKMDGKELYNGTISAEVLSPDIIFIQTFDKMVFGGDYLNNLPGIGVEGKQTYYWNAPEEMWQPFAKLDQDGTYDVFGDSNESWKAYDIKAFRKDRGLDGWNGARCYEHPGYLKVGTGSNYGWFQLPALSAIDGTATVTLTMKLLRFDNTTGTIDITTEGGGDVIGGSLTPENFPAQTKAADRKWTVKTFRIDNATSSTRIKVSTENSADLAKTRFNVDSIVVSTSVKMLTEQLAAVDMETVEYTSGANSINLVWPAVEGADAYSVTICPLDNPNFRYTIEAGSSQCSFDNIPSGIYILEMQAISLAQPQFNSEVTSKVVATEGIEIPELGIEVAFVNASQYGVRWTASNWKNFDKDYATAYRLATYTDEACTKLHSAFIFPANNSIFNSTRNIPYQYSPQFMVAGLDAGKDYWIQVTATDYGLSTVTKITTEKSKVVTMPATTASAGDIILYEDFSEWCFGGACVEGFPSWALKTTTAFYDNYMAKGENPTADGKLIYCTPEKHSGLMNSFKWHVPNTRLKDWGCAPESNTAGALCMASGEVKIGASSKCAQIVTPAITCLSGTAVVEVSFDAAPYMDPTSGTSTPYKYDPATCIVQVYNNSEHQDEEKYINHEIGTPSETEVHKFRIPTASDNDYKWTRYTYTVTVKNGDSIGIGSYRDDADSGNSNKQRRMYLDNIQLKVISYK